MKGDRKERDNFTEGCFRNATNFHDYFKQAIKKCQGRIAICEGGGYHLANDLNSRTG